MERLNSNPHNSTLCLSLRHCKARVSEVCLQRGGWIEPDRAAIALYCSLCAPLVRREQSNRRKRELRKQDWRKYHNDYSPFDKEQWRVYHRDYMRQWRARHREAEILARTERERRVA